MIFLLRNLSLPGPPLPGLSVRLYRTPKAKRIAHPCARVQGASVNPMIKNSKRHSLISSERELIGDASHFTPACLMKPNRLAYSPTRRRCNSACSAATACHTTGCASSFPSLSIPRKNSRNDDNEATTQQHQGFKCVDYAPWQMNVTDKNSRAADEPRTCPHGKTSPVQLGR